ncbi:MAG: hypothetical protein HDR11_10810 [Lachnospiraceae bacterium]|nr:hypothetical protein [Lachnospiraceae bacterium]MDE5804511.1 hypothetical protein [Lachnospiraceae bacterium]
MRQLRLKWEDSRYAFLHYGSEQEDKVEAVRQRIVGQADLLRTYSFAEAPFQWQEGEKSYKAGFVPCEKEAVVSLPEKGSVFILGSEGGFLVAAEF